MKIPTPKNPETVAQNQEIHGWEALRRSVCERNNLWSRPVNLLRTSCCYSECNSVLRASCSALTFKSVSVRLIDWLCDLLCYTLQLQLSVWLSLPDRHFTDYRSHCISSLHVFRAGKSFNGSKGSYRSDRRDFWGISLLLNNWIESTWICDGPACTCGGACMCVCLLIEWMSWSVTEMRLRRTGGLLVGEALPVLQDRKQPWRHNVQSVNVRNNTGSNPELLSFILQMFK